MTRPDPTRPDPTRPDPTRPDPTRPDPTRPDPTRGSIRPVDNSATYKKVLFFQFFNSPVALKNLKKCCPPRKSWNDAPVNICNLSQVQLVKLTEWSTHFHFSSALMICGFSSRISSDQSSIYLFLYLGSIQSYKRSTWSEQYPKHINNLMNRKLKCKNFANQRRLKIYKIEKQKEDSQSSNLGLGGILQIWKLKAIFKNSIWHSFKNLTFLHFSWHSSIYSDILPFHLTFIPSAILNDVVGSDDSECCSTTSVLD